MGKRNGEKIGWIGGWLGGFIWALILGIVRLVQHRWYEGGIGLVLVALGVMVVFSCAPWRRPAVAYWKLMLPIYAVFFVTVAWAVETYGGMKAAGLDCWSFSWVLPMLIPLGTAGLRTWDDPGPGPKS